MQDRVCSTENAGKRAVIWGAGHIGRGFVAGIMREGGYAIDFVDRDEALVAALNRQNSYTLIKATPEGIRKERVEGGFAAIHTSDAAALEAIFDREELLIDIAVFKNDLDSVCDMLSPLLARRAAYLPDSKIDFMMNVNMTRPDEAFVEMMRARLCGKALAYFDKNAGVTGIFAMCISPATPAEYLAEDPLALFNNDYFEQAVSASAFKGELPRAPRLRLSDRLEAEETRKLYTLNMAHCATAYLGQPKGLKTSFEAVQDPDIRAAVAQALDESAIGLIGEFGFDADEMAVWKKTMFSLLDNPYIADGLDRLGADSRRKLGASDRLVMPALLCLKHGGKPEALAKILRAGYDFENADDGTRHVRAVVLEKGLSRAIGEVSGLAPESTLHKMIFNA